MTHWSNGTMRPLSQAYAGAWMASASDIGELLLLGDGLVAGCACATQHCLMQHRRVAARVVTGRGDVPVGADEHPGGPPDVVVRPQLSAFVVHDGDLGPQVADLRG